MVVQYLLNTELAFPKISRPQGKIPSGCHRLFQEGNGSNKQVGWRLGFYGILLRQHRASGFPQWAQSKLWFLSPGLDFMTNLGVQRRWLL